MPKYFAQKFCIAVFVLFSGCVHATQNTDGYPDAWWKPVPEDQIKDWEIPPQAANRAAGEVVLSKRTELGDFSNLGKGGFTLDGVQYASVEGLWQGMKYPEGPNDERLKDPTVKWPYTRAQVYAMTGFEAKEAGNLANANMKKLGIKWVTYFGEKIEYNGSGKQRHYDIILNASRAKIAFNTDLKKLLLSTGNLKFMPDHKQAADSSPAYFYHDIYMKIREEVRAQNQNSLK